MYGFDKNEIKLLRALSTPAKIQDYLQKLRINFDDDYYSPRRVMKTRRAACLDGAIFAAAALMVHGQLPLLLDLKTAKGDVDHVVALFRRRGRWGAISKTNHAVLRYREPLYRDVRELVMSYFHEYFLDDGRKMLRSFSQPLDLSRFNKKLWTIDPKSLEHIAEALDFSPHERIIPPSAVRQLRRADLVERKAGKIVEWKQPRTFRRR